MQVSVQAAREARSGCGRTNRTRLAKRWSVGGTQDDNGSSMAAVGIGSCGSTVSASPKAGDALRCLTRRTFATKRPSLARRTNCSHSGISPSSSSTRERASDRTHRDALVHEEARVLHACSGRELTEDHDVCRRRAVPHRHLTVGSELSGRCAAWLRHRFPPELAGLGRMVNSLRLCGLVCVMRTLSWGHQSTHTKGLSWLCH